MNVFLGIIVALFAGATGLALIALCFLNLIVAALCWPDILVTLAQLLNRPTPHPEWYLCMLIGFIPFIGRWWVTLLLWWLIPMML